MDKMILKNGATINLEAGASLGALQVSSADKITMAETWDQLTDDNLKAVQIQSGDGLTIGNYADLILVDERSTVREDGSILTTYHLRELTETEKAIRALQEGQSVQDGAIEDIAAVASVLAEQAEGGGQ